MSLTLPPLPYALDALEPHVSRRTLGFHHGHHHAGYVQKTRALVRATPLESASLAEIVRVSATETTRKALFNAAAQAWNHAFYWRSLHPAGRRSVPSPRLAARIAKDFGGHARLLEQLKSAALSVFGSGWAWLLERDGRLRVETTANADCPITSAGLPVLVIDVWEHAYYLDYRARRADYVTGVLEHLLDWEFAARNLSAKALHHA